MVNQDIGASESLLIAMVKEENIKAIKTLISKNNIDINCHDEHGITPLMYAIWNENIKIIRLLLETVPIHLPKTKKAMMPYGRRRVTLHYRHIL